MAIFNSFLYVYQRVPWPFFTIDVRFFGPGSLSWRSPAGFRVPWPGATTVGGGPSSCAWIVCRCSSRVWRSRSAKRWGLEMGMAQFFIYIYIYGTTDWLGKKLSIVTNYSAHQLRLKIEAPFFWDRLEWLECICISRKSICSVGKRPMTWPKKNPDGWTSGYLKGALGTSLMDTMTPMTITHRIHGAGIYGNIWGILMVNVTIYGIHGSYGLWLWDNPGLVKWWLWKLQPELHGDLTQKHGWYFQWSSDFGRRVAEAPVRLLLEPMCLVVSSMEYTHVVIFTAYAFFWKDRTSWKHGKQQISAAGNVLIYIYI